MHTLLFYDIETTGLNRCFDQVLQFSAIRTDLNLNELERHTCDVQLRPDVIPSPGAVLTHRISIAQACSGMCEFEATQYIHRVLNTPGTISLGFNTLGFDDEFLRFAFFRNLLPPYTHQHANNCFRADILPITIAYWLYRHEVLEWPRLKGRPTLKLEHLNAANDLADGPAHDAMADVEATLALARRLHAETRMWDYLMGCFEKKTDAQRCEQLPEYMQSPAGNHRLGLMIDSRYGFEDNFQVPVISIGQSQPYKNQFLWLRLDLPALQDTRADTVQDTTWVVRKKYGEPNILLPPLSRFRGCVNPERWKIVTQNRSWLNDHPDLFQKIILDHQRYEYPQVPRIDLDASLYELGFMTPYDLEVSRRFHGADIPGKIRVLETFERPEIRRLAVRLMARNFPGALPGRYQRDYERYLERINPDQPGEALLDYRGQPRTTPRSALKKIVALNADISLGARQAHLLDELERYLRTQFKV